MRSTGSLSKAGAKAVHPNGSSFVASSGARQSGCLSGPSSANFDLYLQRLRGSTWITMASSARSTSSERVVFAGPASRYRWVVVDRKGSGRYTLTTALTP